MFMQPTLRILKKEPVNGFSVFARKYYGNKNAFQWDAYHPLVARTSQHALRKGGSAIPACTEADTPPPREQNERQV